MWVRLVFARLVPFLALVGAIGCKGDTLGQWATVSGTVSHNGTPVDGAKVEFHGTTEVDKAHSLFSAYTDSSGKYVISGVGKNPGIPPGLYKVVITKYIGAKGMMPDTYDPGQIEAMISDGQGGAGPGLKNLLPKQYASPATTKLSSTVESGKNENMNFDLKDK